MRQVKAHTSRAVGREVVPGTILVDEVTDEVVKVFRVERIHEAFFIQGIWSDGILYGRLLTPEQPVEILTFSHEVA